MKPHVAPGGEEGTDELAGGLTLRPGSCTGAEAKGCMSRISWEELSGPQGSALASLRSLIHSLLSRVWLHDLLFPMTRDLSRQRPQRPLCT